MGRKEPSKGLETRVLRHIRQNAAQEVNKTAGFPLPDELVLMVFERVASLRDVVSLGQVSQRLRRLRWFGTKTWICSRYIDEYIVRTPEDVVGQGRLFGCREAAHLKDYVRGEETNALQTKSADAEQCLSNRECF